MIKALGRSRPVHPPWNRTSQNPAEVGRDIREEISRTNQRLTVDATAAGRARNVRRGLNKLATYRA